jgi:ribose transport system ATP-binding protein
LYARGLTKIFAGQTVLDHVDINVPGGEIHALLGANGSGKSTLVKILSGVYQPEAGEICIGGKTLAAITSPHEANARGIAVVHQEAPLIDSLTVAECIAQFRGYPTRAGRIRWKELHSEVAAMLGNFGVEVRPDLLAGRLSSAERALVAIIIALDRVKAGLKLLILDEVTASLPRNQAEPYLDRIAAIARSSVGILMVTHRLAELHGRASSLTLLRDGRVALQGPAPSFDTRQIVAEMIGSSPRSPARSSDGSTVKALRHLWDLRGAPGRVASPQNTPALVLDQVTSFRLKGISFAVDGGEIVGIAGLSEAGINELPYVLGGIVGRKGGNILVNGRPLPPTLGPREVIEAGMAVLPADRHHSGGIGSLSVADNMLLPELVRYWHRPRREKNVLKRMSEMFDLRPPSPATIFGRLSGGNQQKALLAKWLLTRPNVMVLDDPTNGVDPNAREKIFDLLRDAARENVGVLIFSTEPEQFATICSRVLILREGVIAHELSGVELTPQTISQWCYA